MPEIVLQQASAVQVTVSPGMGAAVVVNGTATSIVGSAGINPFVAGDNITITTTGGGITIFGRDPPVETVQGKTGDVILSAADVGAAETSHTHTPASIVGFTQAITDEVTQAIAIASLVHSVAGRTGDVLLTSADVGDFTTAAASAAPVQTVAGRTGSVVVYPQDIPGFLATAAIAAPVQLVAGRSGNVTLSAADIVGLTAWQATHTHSFSSPVASVQGMTGTVTLTFADISAASETHTHDFVTSLNTLTGDVAITSGSGITVNVSGNSVEIAATGGGSGSAVALWPSIIFGG